MTNNTNSPSNCGTVNNSTDTNSASQHTHLHHTNLGSNSLNSNSLNSNNLNPNSLNSNNLSHNNLSRNSLSPNELDPTKLDPAKLDQREPSLVPKSITIGLAIFALILSLAGYVFRIIAGHPVQEVLRHAAILIPLFVIVIPFGFWVGALIMNKIKGLAIQRRNALTLGLLISCVTMLWFMGTYS